MPHEEARWAADAYRRPAYQYRDGFCVIDAELVRRPLNATDRERLWGFPENHTYAAMPAEGRSIHPETCEDVRADMLGNSFHVPPVGYLLGFLGHQLGWRAAPPKWGWLVNPSTIRAHAPVDEA